MYKISCFADELAEKFTDQLDIMEKHQIHWLSLRSVNDVGVLELSDSQLTDIRAELTARGVGVSSIGSPIGKTPITDDTDAYLEDTKRAVEIAGKMDCPRIRVFSFYMENSELDLYRNKVIDRLSGMTELAAASGVTLIHENEARIYGEKSTRCRDLLTAVNHPNFRAVLDPSNFVAAGEDPFDQSLPQVKDFVAYLHIKDSRHSDGVIVPAGEGDGQVGKILAAMAGQNLFTTLEPHLAQAGQFRGFTGAERFDKAYNSLVNLFQENSLDFE